MTILDAGYVAKALGGEARGNRVSAPAPGHSAKDRSLSILVDEHAPDGFVVHGFADDTADALTLKDYVRGRLGLPEWKPERPNASAAKPKPKIVCHYEYQDAEGEPYLRVTRLSDKSFRQWHWDIDGWAPKAPTGAAVPYRLPDILANPDATIWLCEGEKDADRLASIGLIATTNPGGSSAFSADIAKWLDGQTVVALPDNDAAGRKWADIVARLLPDSIIVHLPGLANKGDVSDWIDAGGTVDGLLDLAANPPTQGAIGPDSTSPGLTPTPFTWAEPSAIPQREVIYGSHLYRKFVSATIAPGGVGKSSLVMMEALCMASGEAKLGEPIYDGPLRVWYWNGEDPQDENQRRIVAAAIHHGITPDQFTQRLWMDSGREMQIRLADMARGDLTVNESLFVEIEEAILARGIDLLVIDPLVSAHTIPENDNGSMDIVIKRLGRVAGRCRCAIEIVHHVRKPANDDTKITVHDARGAGSIIAGVRAARVLNNMTTDEALAAGIPVADRFSYVSVEMGKANLAKRDGVGVWRKLVGVGLGNGSDIRGEDWIGVVEKFDKPVANDGFPDDAAAQAQRMAESSDTYRHWNGSGPPPGDWFGFAIARAFGMDEVTERKKIRSMIGRWIKAEVLALREGINAQNNHATFITSTRERIVTQVQPTSDDGDSPF